MILVARTSILLSEVGLWWLANTGTHSREGTWPTKIPNKTARDELTYNRYRKIGERKALMDAIRSRARRERGSLHKADHDG
jgi:hypothetical protein